MSRRKSKKKDHSQLIEKLVIGGMVLAILLAVGFNYLAGQVQRVASKEGGFDVLHGVKFIQHGGNDGDSFHIAYEGEEFVFRLYYVDCPETSSARYRDRVVKQGEYFGLGVDEVVAVGLDAKDYVEDLLRKGELVIYTRWEEVYTSGRYYAFVRVDGEWLSELLVQRGLARIYTKGVGMPDGESFKAQREDLREMEAEAKRGGLGAWGEE